MQKRIKDTMAGILTSYNDQGTMRMRTLYPHDVLDIHSREELQENLKHYAVPNMNLRMAHTREARLHYVKHIRPALRYFCKRLGVPVPTWLKEDKFLEDMGPKERLRLFGKLRVVPHEFGSEHIGDEDTEKTDQATGQ